MSLSVADLEQQLEQARAEAEAEAERRAIEAKETAAAQRRALAAGQARLEELEAELASAAGVYADDRGHLLRLRGRARLWLHGGNPESVSRGLELLELAQLDQPAGVLHDLHVRLMQASAALTGEAGLDENHDLVIRADDAECAAWAGLMQRIRFLAGEDA
jgi:phage terminase Nu1 subunit (DNA packaging protein)